MVYYVCMDTFSALADPTRRNIVELLAQCGQLSATDIYNKFTVSHPAISQHLKVLKEANIVEVEKRAQQRIYKINTASISDLEKWISNLTTLLEERFSRLDKVLEEEKKKHKK